MKKQDISVTRGTTTLPPTHGRGFMALIPEVKPVSQKEKEMKRDF